jgi:hypothetical protein
MTFVIENADGAGSVTVQFGNHAGKKTRSKYQAGNQAGQ